MKCVYILYDILLSSIGHRAFDNLIFSFVQTTKNALLWAYYTYYGRSVIVGKVCENHPSEGCSSAQPFVYDCRLCNEMPTRLVLQTSLHVPIVYNRYAHIERPRTVQTIHILFFFHVFLLNHRTGTRYYTI